MDEWKGRVGYFFVGLIVGFLLSQLPCKTIGCTKETMHAIAHIYRAKEVASLGIVSFEQQKDGLTVRVRLKGIAPGDHGFHIHEYGDCTDEAFVRAGDHFNPTHHPHSGPTNEKKHLGDLGNISADAEGNVIARLFAKGLSLQGIHGVIGRSVIIHEKPDDYTTQPTGDSGARIGCGIIGKAKSLE